MMTRGVVKAYPTLKAMKNNNNSSKYSSYTKKFFFGKHLNGIVTMKQTCK